MYKFKKVSKDTFESYTKYLESKNRLYFTKARRFLMRTKMKKGPLSKKEKAFIDDNKSMSTEDIANKLERSVSVVSRYVEINNQEDPTYTSELFARKEDRGVTVMTEAASMAGDENKSKRKTESPKRYQGVIHKIKED